MNFIIVETNLLLGCIPLYYTKLPLKPDGIYFSLSKENVSSDMWFVKKETGFWQQFISEYI